MCGMILFLSKCCNGFLANNKVIVMFIIQNLETLQKMWLPGRVEMSTEFPTRVPDTHYPTGTQVLVTVNLLSC